MTALFWSGTLGRELPPCSRAALGFHQVQEDVVDAGETAFALGGSENRGPCAPRIPPGLKPFFILRSLCGG